MDSVLTVGRYSVDEWLSSGAMGVVFRGYDRVLDRPVAIKSLRRELAKGSAAQGWHDRFRRRARAAGRLFHPNIAAVLDFGEDHDVPFIAMEYIDGSGLDRLLKSAGRLAPRHAATIMLQILDALKYSHESGVVHLDLKSSIILLVANDRVKVVDFGAALPDIPEAAGSGEISTPYAAPEQLVGDPVDHRTDLFAAGALLFEMLTGATPFRGASVDEIVAQIGMLRAENICTLNPEVPRALVNVVETALSHEPSQRFASAGEFSRALGDAVPLGSDPEAVMRPTNTREAASESGWDPEILRKVEGDLVTHIGPVAPFAVRRAIKRNTNDLAALYEELAAYIDNERERAKFLQSGARLAAAGADQIVLAPGDLPGAAKSRGTLSTDPPDAAWADAIEAKLAQHVGPIARILVKQQLQNFRGLPELYLNLADHISDDAERAAFLASVRA